MELLEVVFVEWLISRRIWPPHSPGHSAPEFFLWGAAKSKVYENKPESIAELKTVIQTYVQSTTAETLCKVFDNTVRRVTACQDLGWKHFQHFHQTLGT
jgi:hypothetical protein